MPTRACIEQKRLMPNYCFPREKPQLPLARKYRPFTANKPPLAVEKPCRIPQAATSRRTAKGPVVEIGNQSPSGKCRTIFLSHQLAADALAATKRSTAQKTPGRTKTIPPSMEMSVNPNRTTPIAWRAATQTMAKPTRMRNETNRARWPQPTAAINVARASGITTSLSLFMMASHCGRTHRRV